MFPPVKYINNKVSLCRDTAQISQSCPVSEFPEVSFMNYVHVSHVLWEMPSSNMDAVTGNSGALCALEMSVLPSNKVTLGLKS